MRTYKKEDGYFLDVSDIEINITPKEYTMLNNIKQRMIDKYDYQIDRIVGDVESWCEVSYGVECDGCPYEKYCNDVTYNFYKRYCKEEYKKLAVSRRIHIQFGSPQEDLLWSNTMEELIHYAEGEA